LPTDNNPWIVGIGYIRGRAGWHKMGDGAGLNVQLIQACIFGGRSIYYHKGPADLAGCAAADGGLGIIRVIFLKGGNICLE